MIKKECICCKSDICLSTIVERLLIDPRHSLKNVLGELNATSSHEYVCDNCWTQKVLKTGK